MLRGTSNSIIVETVHKIAFVWESISQTALKVRISLNQEELRQSQ